MSSTNVNTSNEHAFNLTEALERVDGDMDLLKEIAEIFLEDSPNQMKEIRDGISNGDATTVERAAHTLKGSAGNFAAKRVYDAAYKLEVIGREERMGEAEGALKTLEKEMEILKEALKTL